MVNVAIAGFGVVGSGVAEVLTGLGLKKKADELVNLKYILVVEDFPGSPFEEYFVKNFAVIENDPTVDVVVETIGGTTAALDFTERALKAGKTVVTSNKELVALHGRRLMELAQMNHVSYLFEASVGGGIPILRPLNECMAANEILEICGILNGTTNYIFTRMIRGGLSFEEALREAQANGYAERDPTADIEGYDTCRKICILASIAFGWHVLPEQVQTIGVTKVTLEDVAYALSCDKKIKLLGRAIRNEDGTVCAYVEPHLVDVQNPLSNVEDVFNGITVKGNVTGDVMFYGRGAGKLPTAGAVVGDVLVAARQIERGAYRPWLPARPDGAVSSDVIGSRWYVRLACGTLEHATELHTHSKNAIPGETAFLTEMMTRTALNEALKGKKVCSLIRVLD